MTYTTLFLKKSSEGYMQKILKSRDVEHLNPLFKTKVLEWREKCNQQGLDILIYFTYRSNEYQDHLYAKGRTIEGRICTYAKGGQSKHNAVNDEGDPAAEAIDFAIMDGKRCDWDDVEGYTKAGMIAEELGLVWAGRWNGRKKELGHIETP